MTISHSYETSARAERVFNNALPPSWLARRQSPDFHVDYVVELEENAQPSGKKFAVQLKGTTSPRYVGSDISFKCDVKHLEYYVDRVTEPVFLVVVDVEKQLAFYVFLQGLIQNQLRGEKWRRKKKKSIRVPRRNELATTKRLSADIDRAIRFMREMRPSSIESAVRHRQHALERIDPRFSVSIDLQNGEPKYRITPRRPVLARLVAQGTSAVRALSHAIRTGKPVSLSPERFRVTGSKLLDKFCSETCGPIRLEIGGKAPADLSILEGNEQTLIPPFRVTIRCGVAEATIEGDLARSPLSFRMAMPRRGKRRQFSIHVSYDQWLGQRLLRAAHFDRIHTLIRAIVERRRISMLLEQDGNPVVTADVACDDLTMVKDFLAILDVIAVARRVARALEVAPPMPRSEEITTEFAEHVAMLDEVLDTGRAEIPVTTFSAKTPVEGFTCGADGLDPEGRFVEAIRIEQPVSLLGAVSADQVLVWEVHGARLSPESLRSYRAGLASSALDIVHTETTRIVFSIRRRSELEGS